MKFGICQFILTALMLMNLGISLGTHGKSRIKKENFFVTLVAVIIDFVLLYYGGFYA